MFYTLRKHWKKSIFAAALASYGSLYAVDKYREYVLRRDFCSKVVDLGHTRVHALQLPRRLHLVLNPQASNGNAVKLFEKNSAPLLHLAGIDVTVIRTDYEGHAKSIVGYIDPNTDGIVVAGGDGTVQEVVTGLMREKDERFRNIPVGIIPLGKENNFFGRVLFRTSRQAEQIGEATLAVIKGDVQRTDILEISTGKKKSYGLNSIHWGAFQQVKVKIDAKKHWWAGPWRKQLSFATRTIRNWPVVIKGEIAFGQKPHDIGSYGVDSQVFQSPHSNAATSVLGRLHDESTSPISSGEEDLQRSQGITGFVNKAVSPKVIDSLALHISLACDKGKDSYIALEIWKPGMSRMDFVKDGFKWLNSNYQVVQSSSAECYKSEWLQLIPQNNEDSFYHIDGETFEAVPVIVSLLKNKLQIFTTKLTT